MDTLNQFNRFIPLKMLELFCKDPNNILFSDLPQVMAYQQDKLKTVGIILPTVDRYSAWPTIRKDFCGNLFLSYTSANHHNSDYSNLILLKSNYDSNNPNQIGYNWDKYVLTCGEHIYYVDNNGTKYSSNHDILPKQGAVSVGTNSGIVLASWTHANYFYKAHKEELNSHDPSKITSPDWMFLRNRWTNDYLHSNKIDKIKNLIGEWIFKMNKYYSWYTNVIQGNSLNVIGNIKFSWHQPITSSNKYQINNPQPKFCTGSPHRGIEIQSGKKFLFVGESYDNNGNPGLFVENYVIFNNTILGCDGLFRIPVGNVNSTKLSEPTPVLFTDSNGKEIIMLFVRNDSSPHNILFSASFDDGVTWMNFKDVNFPISYTPPFPKIYYPFADTPDIMRLSDGRLLLTFAIRELPENGVSRIMVAVSDSVVIGTDANGKPDLTITWKDPVELYSCISHPSNFGNPSSAQLKDGTIITVWYEQIDTPIGQTATSSSDKTCIQACNWELDLIQ